MTDFSALRLRRFRGTKGRNLVRPDAFDRTKHLALTIGQRAFIRTLSILLGMNGTVLTVGSFQVSGKHNAKRRENQTSVRGVFVIIEHMCHV